MDWTTVRHQPRRQPPPRMELVERCWRLRAIATDRELVCGIFQTSAGLEVRAGYRDDLLCSSWSRDLNAARATAEAFRLTLVEDMGGVEELPLDPIG